MVTPRLSNTMNCCECVGFLENRSATLPQFLHNYYKYLMFLPKNYLKFHKPLLNNEKIINYF